MSGRTGNPTRKRSRVSSTELYILGVVLGIILVAGLAVLMDRKRQARDERPSEFGAVGDTRPAFPASEFAVLDG